MKLPSTVLAVFLLGLPGSVAVESHGSNGSSASTMAGKAEFDPVPASYSVRGLVSRASSCLVDSVECLRMSLSCLSQLCTFQFPWTGSVSSIRGGIGVIGRSELGRGVASRGR